MLPYPLFHRFNACLELPQRARANESWSDCSEIERQAVVFAAYFAVVLSLAAVACLARDNTNTDKAMASMMRVTVATEIVIAFCLVIDSCVVLTFRVCRHFPLMPMGLIGSLGLALNQWLASTCLYFRNWMVAVISLSRYRMFQRRRPLDWASFNAAAACLLANAALFALPQAFHSVGYVCANDLWGPVYVAPLLFGVNVTSAYDIVNAAVIIPLQAVLPFLLGFFSSIAVMRILWRHMRPAPPETGQQQLTAATNATSPISSHHRKRYQRPFVAFLVMNATLLLLFLPVVLLRILSLMHFDINSYFWLSNALCNAISLANIGVYFYLCKTCNCARQSELQMQLQQQSGAVTSY